MLYLAGECCGLTLKELGEAVRRFQQQMGRNADLAARFAQAVSISWNVGLTLNFCSPWIVGSRYFAFSVDLSFALGGLTLFSYGYNVVSK